MADASRSPDGARSVASAVQRLDDEGRLAEAHGLLTRVTASGAAEVHVVEMAAEVAGRMADRERALLHAESLRRGAPDTASQAVGSAAAKLAHGREDEAREDLQTALDLDRYSVSAMLMLGELDLRRRRFAAARELALRAQTAGDRSARGARLRARAALQCGDPSGALEAAERAVAMGGAPESRVVLAEVLSQRGGPDGLARAVEELRRALATGVPSADWALQLGRIFRAQGRHSEAVSALRAAIRITPELLEAYPLLAHSYESLQLPDVAAKVRALYAGVQPDVDRIAAARFRAGVARGSRDSLLALAQAYVRAGRGRLAAEILQKPPFSRDGDPRVAELRKRATLEPERLIPSLPEDPARDKPPW